MKRKKKQKSRKEDQNTFDREQGGDGGLVGHAVAAERTERRPTAAAAPGCAFAGVRLGHRA